MTGTDRGGPALRLLLVEDDEDDYVLTRAHLAQSERTRFAVEWVASYEEGLAKALGGAYDVCLVDYRLGARDGIEWIREAVAGGCRSPVVVLTGQADREIDVLAMEAGAADYLVKGQITAELLERSLRYAVRGAQAAAALRASEERYALAVAGVNDGLWDWDLTQDQVYFSPRWKEMLGHPEADVGASPQEWFDRVHPADLPNLRADIEAHLDGRTARFQNEHRMRRRDGSYLYVLGRGLCVRDALGRALRFAGSQSDITARKQAEAKLVHEALHDGLTGLPNRVLFRDRLEHALGRLRQRSDRARRASFAVLFLDLDRFKVINDSLGHLVGDTLLREIGRRLQTCLRPGDTAARLGGDEFAALLEEIEDPAAAESVSRRIGEHLNLPFAVDGQQVYPSASIGITIVSNPHASVEQLLRDADIAMYRAKKSGRHQEVFDSAMHTETVTRMQLETDLRGALDRGELELHYQPMVDLSSGRPVALEALLRWRHPRRGLVAPADFVPILEETRLVHSVGRWVLAEACRQLRAFRNACPALAGLAMSVNVSGVQFSQPGFDEDVREAVTGADLPAESLAIELTESTVMENPDFAAALLGELKRLGVGIYLDDFGTGYSSLACLPRLPIDCLKIDASFVARMEHDRRDREVVRAIVAIARNLGLSLVAEGVQEAAQCAALRRLGCERGQGWLFHPALPPAEALAVLKEAAGKAA
jgi:diguanylate cyclase (GGDEF)-like protein/PAS domain S-box-containing protein